MEFRRLASESVAPAVSLLAMTLVASVTANVVQGQIITFKRSGMPTLAPNTMNLSILFSNNTNASLLNEHITQQQGDMIISAINAVLLLQNEEALEDLEILEPILEEEVEKETEESKENLDSNDNGGNGNNNDDNDNGNGNGNGNGGNGNNDDLELEHIPEPILPELDEDEEDGEEVEELELLNKRDPCSAAYPAMMLVLGLQNIV